MDCEKQPHKRSAYERDEFRFSDPDSVSKRVLDALSQRCNGSREPSGSTAAQRSSNNKRRNSIMTYSIVTVSMLFAFLYLSFIAIFFIVLKAFRSALRREATLKQHHDRTQKSGDSKLDV